MAMECVGPEDVHFADWQGGREGRKEGRMNEWMRALLYAAWLPSYFDAERILHAAVARVVVVELRLVCWNNCRV